ncbi:Density-regulated protein [Balamuthia mandrillaris]
MEDTATAHEATPAAAATSAEETSSGEAAPTGLVAKTVIYCGVCGLPPEFCEYGPDFEACKPWLREHCPEILEEKEGGEKGESTEEGKEGAEGEDEGEKKRQKRGGKGTAKAKKKDQGPPEDAMVGIFRSQRGKRKFVTTITGLGTFGVNLKDASSLFKKKLGCGASVNAEDGTIDIQGDVLNDVTEIISSQAWGVCILCASLSPFSSF